MRIQKSFRLVSILITILGFSCSNPIGVLDNSQNQTKAIASSIVTNNGALKVTGNKVTGAQGQDLQLKGMSFFWSLWEGARFYNANVVNTTVDSWGATITRAAMGIENGGYLTDPSTQKAMVKTVVDAAIAKGIYVIIDWHDHNATQHTAQAKAFFKEMATLYKGVPNVIFEVFNEPTSVSWADVKSYAEAVIGEIRGVGNNNLVVVGSPTWSQDVDKAADNPITSFQNIAYTLHFYAGSHKQGLRDKGNYALNKGIALMVTEWGSCDASGNSNFDPAESQIWLDWMAANRISWANWSICDKPETASILKPGVSANGGWTSNDLTEAGKFVVPKIASGPLPSVSPTATPSPTPTPSDSPGSLSAIFTKQAWNGGYSGKIVIKNNSTQAVTNWTLMFDLPSGLTITDLWSGTKTQSGNTITVKPLSYNATIAAGASTEIGFNANGSSDILNLIVFSGSSPSPTPTITPTPTVTPTPTLTPTPTVTPTPTTTPTPTSSPNSGSLIITKSINSWGTGATIQLSIKNTGTSPVSAWKVSFGLNGKIDNSWNAIITGSGSSYTAIGDANTKTIGANGTVGFGFNISNATDISNLTVSNNQVNPSPSSTPSPTTLPTGDRYFTTKMSVSQMKSESSKISVSQQKAMMKAQIDEHWALLQSKFGFSSKEKALALFCGWATRESTFDAGLETAIDNPPNPAHAFGPLQCAETAYQNSPFPPEPDVVEMVWYMFNDENFFDPIMSLHMGIRHLVHFGNIALSNGHVGKTALSRALMGYNTGWTEGNSDAWVMQYSGEIAAMARWYLENGHLYDDAHTWTGDPQVNRVDPWNWY